MRPHDWPERLIATLERHRACPFEWGVHDCATLVRDVAAALGAADPFAGMTWASKFDAIMALRGQSARSVREFIDRRLTIIEPTAAQRGDLGYPATVSPLMCPAVVVGAEAVSRSETGWVVFPLSALAACYRLG